MHKPDVDPVEVPLALPPADVAVAKKAGNKQTAITARKILLKKNLGFVEPKPRHKKILVVEFAKAGIVVYGQAFDIVKLRVNIDLGDKKDVERNLKHIDLYEIKSTNRKLAGNFAGYFFSLSTAELLVAQSLGKQYRFAFVNIETEELLDLSLTEVFGRAQAIYPSWSIKF